MDLRRRYAVHEAGHAVAALTMASRSSPSLSQTTGRICAAATTARTTNTSGWKPFWSCACQDLKRKKSFADRSPMTATGSIMKWRASIWHDSSIRCRSEANSCALSRRRATTGAFSVGAATHCRDC